ncbi:DUF4932 domain-containing protein, partial [Bacteroidota bacterium]
KYEIVINDLNICIDARMELLFIIQYLSDDYPLINNFDIKYKDEIEQWFEPYKNHEVITKYNEMWPKGFNYDAPPASMLYYSYELKPVREFTPYLIERGGGKESMDKFSSLLYDFAKKSDFQKFFEDHGELYTVILTDLKYNLKGFNEISAIEEYFGKSNKSYTVILTPLGQGNYGPRVKTKDGMEIYSINGARGQNGDIPCFGDLSGFEYLIWHEFGHSFVNPLTEKNTKQVNKVESLFEPIQDKMSEMAYGDWKTTVNEHIIRAYTARLGSLKYGEEEEIQSLGRDYGRGFVYVKKINDKLKEYENNREKYKSFEDFYPVLIKSFQSYTYEGGEIISTINDASGKTPVIIVPTAESDKDAQNKIQEFVQGFKNSFYKKGELITDAEALNRDLSDANIIVFGTVEGNLWLKKHINKLPVIFGKNSITTDKEYKGENLRFISAWMNPENPKNNIRIYTAIHAIDIVNINGVFHGPTNYVIADKYEVLKSGYYSKENNKWKFL